MCVTLFCDRSNVLGWYLCRCERMQAHGSLMSGAEPTLVVSDGGKGFKKASKKYGPHAKHQKCLSCFSSEDILQQNLKPLQGLNYNSC